MSLLTLSCRSFGGVDLGTSCFCVWCDLFCKTMQDHIDVKMVIYSGTVWMPEIDSSETVWKSVMDSWRECVEVSDEFIMKPYVNHQSIQSRTEWNTLINYKHNHLKIRNVMAE